MLLESEGHTLRHLEVLVEAIQAAFLLFFADSSRSHIVDTRSKTLLRHIVILHKEISECLEISVCCGPSGCGHYLPQSVIVRLILWSYKKFLPVLLATFQEREVRIIKKSNIGLDEICNHRVFGATILEFIPTKRQRIMTNTSSCLLI